MPTTLCLIAVLLIPLITSFLEAVIYWFMAGFAFLPLFLVNEARLRRLVPLEEPDMERPSTR